MIGLAWSQRRAAITPRVRTNFAPKEHLALCGSRRARRQGVGVSLLFGVRR